MAEAEPQSEHVRFPGTFAFFGSGCLLVLELVAGRIVAPAIGVSLYTWTSIIAVVLAGVSLGNYLGGKIADRSPKRATLSVLYLLASLSSALILAFVHNLSAVQAPHAWPAVLQVLWLVSILFLLPSTVLGTMTPLLVKLTLSSLGSTGSVVGRIQASATLGSIVGTLLTGFVLISLFGTRAILAGVAAILLILGLLSDPVWSRRRVVEASVIALFIASLTAIASTSCTKESNYYCITVLTGAKPNVRVLQLDLLIHGLVDLDDSTHLLYPYEELYRDVLDRTHTPGDDLNLFAIGGGTYTFPRYVEHLYRGKIDVAEIDPAVTGIARSRLGLPADTRIHSINDDARRVVDDLSPTERYDVVLGDAFNDAAIPFHLTTVEFDRMVAAHLDPTGIYMVNVVDGVHYDFLRSFIATLRTVFPQVSLITSPGHWPPNGQRMTSVVVASREPIAATPTTVSPTDVDAFLARGKKVILTDDHVPVDQLLAPVFVQRLEG